MKKIYILSLALIYAHISRLLAGVKNAPGQGALVSKYVVFDDFGGPVYWVHHSLSSSSYDHLNLILLQTWRLEDDTTNHCVPSLR